MIESTLSFVTVRCSMPCTCMVKVMTHTKVKDPLTLGTPSMSRVFFHRIRVMCTLQSFDKQYAKLRLAPLGKLLFPMQEWLHCYCYSFES